MKFSTHVTAQGNLRATFTQRRTLTNTIQRYGKRRFNARRIHSSNFKHRHSASPIPIVQARSHSSTPNAFLMHIPHAVPAYEARTHYSPDEAADLRERLFVLEEENDSGVILLTPDEIRLVVDSGASCTISNCLDDFISPPTTAQPRELKGIGSGLQIHGIGTVRYVLNNGYELMIPGTLYVPDCPARLLLCPQQLVDTLKCTFTMEPDSDTGRPTCWFEFPGEDSAPPVRLNVPFDPRSNLPMITTAPGVTTCAPCHEGDSIASLLAAFTGTPSSKGSTQPSPEVPSSTGRLSDRQRRLLQWHERLGHINMDQCVRLARHGVIPRELANGPAPKCQACLLSKGKRRPKAKSTIRHQDDTIEPGQVASTDQLIAGYPGRMSTSRGSPCKRRYTCVTIFVDHATRFIYPHFQESTNAKETRAGKLAFEAFGRIHGRTLQHLHSDNGTFVAKHFVADLTYKDQGQSLCGVGAHWQNGIAERTIGAVTSLARTMLSHAMRQWPDVIDESFWPFAVRQSINVLNMLPSPHLRDTVSKLSSYENFTGQKPTLKPEDFHVFGCPAYVLAERLQTHGSGHPKWHNRSHLGVYVGHSTLHSGNVLMIYNPETTHTSPQYHCVVDDSFLSLTNVEPSDAHADKILQHLWDSKRYEHEDAYDAEHYYFDSFFHSEKDEGRVHSGSKRPRDDDTGEEDVHRLPSDSVDEKRTTLDRDEPIGTANAASTADVPCEQRNRRAADDRAATGDTSAHEATAHISTITRNGDRAPFMGTQAHHDIDRISHANPSTDELITPTVTGSESRDYQRACYLRTAEFADYKRRKDIAGRILSVPRPRPKKRNRDDPPGPTRHDHRAMLAKSALAKALELVDVPDDHVHQEAFHANYFEPHVYEAEATGNDDTLTRSQMLKAPDQAEFIKAEAKELDSLDNADVFEFVQKSTLAPDTEYMRAVWSYKRKRRVNGEIYKHKARICVDGSRQKPGIHFDDVLAPVVSWNTVRLVLFISKILKLETRQIDFIQAFTQADNDRDMYMHIPPNWDPPKLKGKDKRDYVLKLRKNLYGSRNAARNWWLFLRKGLLERGFHQSDMDPCLFLRDDCLLLCYVDDCLLAGKSQHVLSQVSADLRKTYGIDDEGEINDFLGVNIKLNPESKTLEFTQTGLIDSILSQLNLHPEKTHPRIAKPKQTPAAGILHADADGGERTQTWKCRGQQQQ